MKNIFLLLSWFFNNIWKIISVIVGFMVLYILFEFVLPIINFFGFFADMISSITKSSEDILEYFEKFDGNNDDLDIDDNKV